MVVKNLRRGLPWKGSYQDNFSLSIKPLLKFDKKKKKNQLFQNLWLMLVLGQRERKGMKKLRQKRLAEQQKQKEQEKENCIDYI